MTTTEGSEFWDLVTEQLEEEPTPSVQATIEMLRAVLVEPSTAARMLVARVLSQLLLGAPFLCRLLGRDPEALAWATQDAVWSQPRTKTLMSEHLAAALGEVVEEDVWMRGARRFRARELLRIAARDLLGFATVRESTRELSLLADVALESACMLTARALREAYGDMAGSDPALHTGFAVLGLGKLGANELNFSSDIDLMFLYNSEGTTTGGCRGAISNQEWAAKAGRMVTRLLGTTTEDGRIFRVDLRLRPEGHAGPIAMTPKAGLAYYDKRARPWEYMALLRARHCAGDPAVSEALLTGLEPVLYRNEVGPELVRSIREVKRQIAAHHEAKAAPGFDVKLGRGGIREIEFFVQTLQLLHAGACATLRTTAVLDILDRLRRAGLIDEPVYASQRDDYSFLRRIEHRLQMPEDAQTHILPRDEAACAALARRMGFATTKAFTERLEQVRERVHLLFLSLFAAEETREEAELREAIASHLAAETPELDGELIRYVLRHWPVEQLRVLPRPAIAEAIALLARVQTDTPVHVAQQVSEEGIRQVRLAAVDATGLAAVSAGVLAASGLEIGEGFLVTIPSGHCGGREVGPWALQFLWVHPSNVGGSSEGDPGRGLVGEWEQLATRYVRGERDTVRDHVNARVVERLRSYPEPSGKLLPVDVELNNRSDARYSIVDVWAEDTPGFLWGFTQALAMRGIRVHHTRIRTAGSRVLDRFALTDRNNRKIIAPAARRELEVLAVLIKAFTRFLTRAADPGRALSQFSCLLDRLGDDELAAHTRTLASGPLLATLATVLGSGAYLFEDFLRLGPEQLLPVLKAISGGMYAPSMPPPAGGSLNERRQRLVAWRDAELFRLDCEHLLERDVSFGAFGERLTRLADELVAAAWGLAIEEVAVRHGWPVTGEENLVASAVFSLGKFGGREPGFGSDLELLVVYAHAGTTSGPGPTSAAAFFEAAVQVLAHILPPRREGSFEIDLQLRPHGSHGPLASSFQAFASYYRGEGGAAPFERQALIRLRPCGGDPCLIAKVLEVRDSFCYSGAPFDLAYSLRLRGKQIRELCRPGWINVKYSPGGLVEIEYAMQYLQLQHGGENAALRHTNTLATLEALAQAGLLGSRLAERYAEAYQLLREVIDALRLERGHSRDLNLPPPGSEPAQVLARRLRTTPAALQAALTGHMRFVSEQFRRSFGTPGL